MSYVLGKPVLYGAYEISIVSKHVVNGQSIGQHGVALHCTKTPTFVVVQSDQPLKVFDMTGDAVTLAQATELCPALASLLRS